MYKRAIIIGGGASIPNDFDWSLLKNEFTIGINYIYRVFEPTIHIFDNDGVYNALMKEKPDTKSFLMSPTCRKTGVKNIPASKQWRGLKSVKERKIYCSSLTGIYTLTTTICLPFEEIYLMGYDLNRTDGRVHFKDLKHTNESMLAYHQSNKFSPFAQYKHIYNVSPRSAIEVFPKLYYSQFEAVLNNYKPKVNQEEAREWFKCQLSTK